MATQKLYIKEDITDWRDETYKRESIIKNREDIVELGSSGLHTAVIARSAIVSREIGEAPEDILRPNKTLLIAGAQLDVSHVLTSEKAEIETESGKKYSIQAFVGNVRERSEKDGDEEDEPREPGISYIPYDDPDALDRAIKYLQNIVPGHIFNRFKQIYASGGDVEAAAEQLKLRIDEFVLMLE